MSFSTRAIIISTFSLALLGTPGVKAQGLYADETKNATSGDLNNQDYWWAKFDAMMLEIAIKQHQPEGHIAVDLASSIRRLEDLSKKFPKHQEIAKWKARALEVDSKINPNADRRASFSAECPWDESNFAQLWVNLHWAKIAYEQHDNATALSCMQNVMQNYQIMMAPDRMKNYPEDLRKYVVDNKPEADKLYAAARARR
jgi:hypothetical protein